MRLWLIAALAALLLGTTAEAQRVAIRTGEHDGFTRLVLTLPQAGEWRLSRASDGYALALGPGRPEFDLSDVFRLIPRTRLADIRTDPADGRLLLRIACLCHARPVELRRGLLVIDLRDGPPPASSPHERDDRGNLLPVLNDPRGAMTGADGGRPGPSVPRDGFPDWRDAAIARANGRPEPAREPDPDQSASAQVRPDRPPAGNWQDRLIAELARGATRGVVDIAPLPSPPDPTDAARPERTNILPQIRIGDGPIPAGSLSQPDTGAMTAAGDPCLPDDLLDVAAWGDPAPVAQAMGPLTRAIMAEFDQLDVIAASRGAQYLLHLGFGAEARQLVDLAGPSMPGFDMMAALTWIVDGAVPPAANTAFEGMAGCDTSAALWSLLSVPPERPVTMLRETAVLRAFSALPLHLRRHLGPEVARRLIAAGKVDAAGAVRDAILRAPGDPGAAVRLMSIDIDSANGTPPAEQDLAGLRSQPGLAGLRATVLSLDAVVASGTEPDANLLTAAEAMLREYQGTAEVLELSRALAGAQGAAGDWQRALDLAVGSPAAEAEVWGLLAARAGNGAFLTHALRRPADLPRALPAATDHAIGRRLLEIGFPREAMPWLDPARRRNGQQGLDDRLLMAQALLADGAGREAIDMLTGLGTTEAEAIRTRAILALNAAVSAETTLSPEDKAVLARRAGNWETVAQIGPDVWREAASLLTPPPPRVDDGAGPLAQGRAMRDESAAARARIDDLLDASRLADPL